MNVVVGLVGEVSVPKINCFFAGQVICDAQYLRRYLLTATIITSFQEGNRLFLHTHAHRLLLFTPLIDSRSVMDLLVTFLWVVIMSMDDVFKHELGLVTSHPFKTFLSPVSYQPVRVELGLVVLWQLHQFIWVWVSVLLLLYRLQMSKLGHQLIRQLLLMLWHKVIGKHLAVRQFCSRTWNGALTTHRHYQALRWRRQGVVRVHRTGKLFKWIASHLIVSICWEVGLGQWVEATHASRSSVAGKHIVHLVVHHQFRWRIMLRYCESELLSEVRGWGLTLSLIVCQDLFLILQGIALRAEKSLFTLFEFLKIRHEVWLLLAHVDLLFVNTFDFVMASHIWREMVVLHRHHHLLIAWELPTRLLLQHLMLRLLLLPTCPISHREHGLWIVKRGCPCQFFRSL